VRGIAEMLDRGLLLIDYGYPRHEYYHAQRRAGTLLYHYRHQAHDDPFLAGIAGHHGACIYRGRRAGVAAELDVIGYQPGLFPARLWPGQAVAVNTGNRLDAYLRQAGRPRPDLPGEMGERFKCMGWRVASRDPCPVFALTFRYRL
jgi:hypothetical protein